MPPFRSYVEYRRRSHFGSPRSCNFRSGLAVDRCTVETYGHAQALAIGTGGQPVRSIRNREPGVDRPLHATFGSPRRAVEAITRLRRELPGLSVELRPLGDPRHGAEPEFVDVFARIPWRWCRAAVLLLVAIDETARLEWDDTAVADEARARS
jgi:hypothetical protein